MEPDVPNLFIMFSGHLINQPEYFLGSGVEDEINDPRDRAPDDLSEEREKVLRDLIPRMVENEQLIDYTKGVNTQTAFMSEIIAWTPSNVMNVVLHRVMSLAYKAHHRTETLIVLDRPLDPDRALSLMTGLRDVATQLNALDCNIKVRFGLLGTGVIHVC